MSADCELEEDVGEAAVSDEIERRMLNFKEEKAKQRLKNKLLRILDEHDYSSRREISDMCNQLSDAPGTCNENHAFLSMEYALIKDRGKI